jgi:hypothetical protein
MTREGGSIWHPRCRGVGCANPPRTAVLGVALLIGLVGSGCKEGASRQQPPSPGGGAAVSTTSSVGQPQGLLKRHGPPPSESVAAQAAFFGGAGGPDTRCRYRQLPSTGPASLLLASGDNPIEVFEAAEVCFVGFRGDRAIETQVLGPDKKLERRTHEPDEAFIFSRLPSDPLGRYRIDAEQGAVRAGLVLTLVPASVPTQMVVQEGAGPPTVVALSGFAEHQSIAVRFYGPGPCDIILQGSNRGNVLLPYITSVSVRADGDGQATYSWPGDPDDRGCFGVLADGVNPVQPVIRVGQA